MNVILGSSVREQKWLELQRDNSNHFDSHIILSHNFTGGDLELFKDGYIPSHCRNIVIKEFLKTDGTHLVWIDEDMALDETNYNKLIESIKLYPNALLYGERKYSNVMDHRRIYIEFKNGNKVKHNMAYSCFVVLPRVQLEKELDDDWFPEFFDGLWGFEDLALHYKFTRLFNSEAFFTDAFVKSMGEENNIEGVRTSMQCDMLNNFKRTSAKKSNRRLVHYSRIIDHVSITGYKKGVIPIYINNAKEKEQLK